MSRTLPKVLLVGYKGQVGTEMSELLKSGGYTFVAIDVEECDLGVAGAVTESIRKERPNVIVNAAAYTAVDKAESNTTIASIINAAAPTEMAKAAREAGALFVHYSTDYVFNGAHATPWIEGDPTGPINAYGRTKLDGENGVLASGAAAFIFRTSWVYGSHGANFLRTMVRLASSREELSVVQDQVGAPTWSRSLAEVTMHTIRKFTAEDGSLDVAAAAHKAGIYHASCGGVTNWFDFAVAIFDEVRAHGIALKVQRVLPITTEQYPCAAARPRYSVLSNEKLQRELGFTMPEWRVALRAVVAESVQRGSFVEATSR